MKIILPIVVGSSLLISGWKPIDEREIFDFFIGDWIVLCGDRISNQPLYTEDISYLQDKKFIAKRTDKYGQFSYSGKYSISRKGERYLMRYTNIFSASRNVQKDIAQEVRLGARTIAVSTYENVTCVIGKN